MLEPEAYLSKVTEFSKLDKKILALRAYSNFLSVSNDPKFFTDFILQCNALAVQEIHQYSQLKDITNAHAAQEYLEFALNSFELSTEEVVSLLNNFNSSDFLPFLRGETGQNPLKQSLLAITLLNWTCKESLLENVSRSEELFALSTAIVSRITLENDAISCALPVTLWALWEGLFHLFHCTFPEAISSVEPLIENESEGDNTIQGEASSNLVKGLASMILCVAQEHENPEVAAKHYEEAFRFFSNWEEEDHGAVLSEAKQCIEWNLERLGGFIGDARVKAEAAQLELEKQAEAAKQKRGRKSKALATHPPPKRKGQHRKSTLISTRMAAFSEMNRLSSYLPPIGSTLCTYIRNHGLPLVVIPFTDKTTLFHKLIPQDSLDEEEEEEEGEEEEKEPFRSPFVSNISDVLVCCICRETPLQWAVKVEEARDDPCPKRTVWNPRPTTQLPFLFPEPVEIVTQPEKGPMEVPVPVVSSPRPLAEGATEKAKRGVNGVLLVLNQRLTTLLKVERAFEERWNATNRIRNALQCYYVPQQLLQIKKDLIESKRRREKLLHRSALIITRFFRRVVEEQPRKNGFKTKDEKRREIEEKSAIVLQKYTRRWLAQKELARLKELERQRILSITTVQGCYRRNKACKRVALLREEKQRLHEEAVKSQLHHFAATQIQRVFRGHSVRLALLRERGEHLLAIKHHYHDSRHYFATLIQAVARGREVRRRYGRAVRAKRIAGRNKYESEILRWAAVTIQRVFRGHLARMRNSGLLCELKRRGIAIPLTDEILERRRAIAKRESEIKEKRAAALRIVQWIRMLKAKALLKEKRVERSMTCCSRIGETYKPFKIALAEF